jgi:hypothetical protein
VERAERGAAQILRGGVSDEQSAGGDDRHHGRAVAAGGQHIDKSATLERLWRAAARALNEGLPAGPLRHGAPRTI